jgi:small subunit ribosomal protein S33
LRGPALAAYYPRKVATIQDLIKAYPELDIIDEEEEDRLESIRMYDV